MLRGIVYLADMLKLKTPRAYQKFLVALEVQMLKELRKRAVKNDRTVSAEIRQILRGALIPDEVA